MKELEIQRFFPEQLEIKNVFESDNRIVINLESHSEAATCPFCGTIAFRICTDSKTFIVRYPSQFEIII